VMIFEHERWSGDRRGWEPSAEAGVPWFVGTDGRPLTEDDFRMLLEAKEILCVIDTDTDAVGWSYGTIPSRMGTGRPSGRGSPLPLDTVRRRRWLMMKAATIAAATAAATVGAGRGGSSAEVDGGRGRRMSIGGGPMDDSDWEAVRKILQLLQTYMGKRNATDWVSVAMDPTIGFRLLKQHSKAYNHSLEAACSLITPRDAGEHVDLLSNVARAACFACAAYGAPMASGRLDTIGAFCGGAAAHFIGTWTHAQNSDAFVRIARITQEDLLLASWTERTFEPAFCLAWAHERRWLVLSVRGTVDWRAVLTDVAAHPAPVGGGFAHEGMLRAARTVLERALPSIRRLLHERPDYSLVCAGHSLGAGVAVLAALLLRSGGHVTDSADVTEDPPALRETTAYAIAAPPLLSPKLAEECQPWAVSVVRGRDFISRLSVFQVDRLVFELTQASAAKKAKDWFSNAFGWTEDSAKKRYERNFGDGKEVAELLSPPGRILHLDTRGHKCGQGAPAAYWAPGDFYHRYLLSTSMVADHLPKAYHIDVALLASVAGQEASKHQQTLACFEDFILPSFVEEGPGTFALGGPMDGGASETASLPTEGGGGHEADDDSAWE